MDGAGLLLVPCLLKPLRGSGARDFELTVSSTRGQPVLEQVFGVARKKSAGERRKESHKALLQKRKDFLASVR